MADLLKLVYSADEIRQKRATIGTGLQMESENIEGNVIDRLSPEDLRLMFELYDQVFFQNWFRNNFRGQMKFSLSGRMTKSAGLTLCPKNISKMAPEKVVLEIRIGIDLIFRFGEEGGCRKVCGIPANSSLEALQLVFEHELCHGVEFILFHRSSCKGKRFRELSGRIFGHTERVHALNVTTGYPIPKSTKRVGEPVTFLFKGRELSGVIYSINKRAAIMVKDRSGRYTDRQGVRYSKYYVPLPMLK